MLLVFQSALSQKMISTDASNVKGIDNFIFIFCYLVVLLGEKKKV